MIPDEAVEVRGHEVLLNGAVVALVTTPNGEPVRPEEIAFDRTPMTEAEQIRARLNARLRSIK